MTLTYSEKMVKIEMICKMVAADSEQKLDKELIRYYGEVFDLVWLFVNDETAFDKYGESV